jgi:hypothetical protein
LRREKKGEGRTKKEEEGRTREKGGRRRKKKGEGRRRREQKGEGEEGEQHTLVCFFPDSSFNSTSPSKAETLQ